MARRRRKTSTLKQTEKMTNTATDEAAALYQIRLRIAARRDKHANRAKSLSASLRKLNAFRDAPASKSRPKTRKGAFLV